MTYIPIGLVEIAIHTYTFLKTPSVPIISNFLSSTSFDFS
jgi:hypothetical protein